MSATPESKEEIRQLFRRHVPEVAAGTVEIVDIAREAGRRSYIAVRSQTAQVDPVGACAGPEGSRAKGMVRELKGEHLDVVLWHSSAEIFIRHAFGPHCAAEVVFDQPAHRALVTLDRPNLQPSRDLPTDVRLIAELTGWSINVRSTTE
jgi:N utilization substance protein A